MLCSFLCLVGMMQHGASMPERIWALQRLRDHGGVAALPYVAAVALDGGEPAELRAAAAEALAARRRSEASPFLEPLVEDPDLPVRSAAAGSLAALAAADPELLQRTAMSDPNPQARLKARARASRETDEPLPVLPEPPEHPQALPLTAP